MLPRFFAPDPPAEGSRGDISLPDEEARHALNVLRLRTGDELSVFDGRGHEWRARITSTSKASVSVRLEAPLETAAEPRVRVTLLHAVLKGDHMDGVVRDATMMGVAEIRPAITSHTVARATSRAAAGAQQRWVRVAIASAKQCRRAVVPIITAAVSLEDALAERGTAEHGARIVLAEPTVRDARAQSESETIPKSALVAVGPEGGWSREELARFEGAGFVSLTLGTLTLRADAAAVVALSVLRERWGDL